MTPTEHSRQCPSCNNTIYHVSEKRLKAALKKPGRCSKCAQRGISKGKGRKQSRGHIEKRAAAVSLYRKGKTYGEIYGEDKGREIAKEHSIKMKGRKRPEFSEEWKENMSNSRKTSKVYKAFMNSKEYKEKRRAINAARFYNISLEEWYSQVPEKKLYYLKVLSITRQQELHTLEHYEKRGNYKTNGYHLDHIYPISLGFKNNIPPETVGDITNLQYIPWRDNLQKSNKLL
jgi:hypothetical protein